MYVDGFVTAVPKKNKQQYVELAKKMVPLFKEFGATKVADCWQDDVPHGKLTDFYGAVKATEDEAVVFSYIEYPSKAVRDAASERMMADPKMKELMESAPFDGKRMIFGGFESIQ